MIKGKLRWTLFILQKAPGDELTEAETEMIKGKPRWTLFLLQKAPGDELIRWTLFLL